MAIHAQPEFISTRSGKDQQRNVDSEIGNLKAITNLDVGKCGPADQMFGIEVHQVDIEMIQAFGIGEAEVKTHVLMLKWKRGGL